jgi:hypothetical protein
MQKITTDSTVTEMARADDKIDLFQLASEFSTGEGVDRIAPTTPFVVGSNQLLHR